MRYGAQIGVIVYGGGVNISFAVERARKKGYIVVFCSGYARIHNAK